MIKALLGFDIQNEVGYFFQVLLIMIVFDIITGLLASAREKKINSSINYDGIITKIGEIVGLFFMSFADLYLKTNGAIVKVGVGMLIVYEAISIIENFSRIGVNIKFLTKYFDPEKVGKGEETK
jgi:toxin secretion/phage lysis holin